MERNQMLLYIPLSDKIIFTSTSYINYVAHISERLITTLSLIIMEWNEVLLYISLLYRITPPHNTTWQLFSNLPPEIKNRQMNPVCRIQYKWTSSDKNYVRNNKVNSSALAKLAVEKNQTFNFDNVELVDYNTRPKKQTIIID